MQSQKSVSEARRSGQKNVEQKNSYNLFAQHFSARKNKSQVQSHVPRSPAPSPRKTASCDRYSCSYFYALNYQTFNVTHPALLSSLRCMSPALLLSLRCMSPALLLCGACHLHSCFLAVHVTCTRHLHSSPALCHHLHLFVTCTCF